jgi:hypothetical protein
MISLAAVREARAAEHERVVAIIALCEDAPLWAEQYVCDGAWAAAVNRALATRCKPEGFRSAPQRYTAFDLALITRELAAKPTLQ